MIRHRSAQLPSRRPRRTRRIIRLGVESLEGRALLSSIDSFETILPAVTSIIADRGWNFPGSQSSGGLTNPSPDSTAMTPAEILASYGFSGSATAGAGTTIAIVDAYNDPNIQADLATFDAYYGLPSTSLTVVNQTGQTSNLPATDPNWSLEIAMDVEWAHAVAPGANIVLVEASSTSVSDLMTAVQTAARMSNVVSMSWGGDEWLGQTAYDSAAYFANPNVTFVAASGDDGGANGAQWPASSPYVLSVGGTSLTLNSSGTYGGESGWSASVSLETGYTGSTGGVSGVESLPSYQANALGSNYASGRVVPDVSMDADPSTGVSVFSSVAGLSQSGWFKVGGTSAGAPIWSGLVATADQARAASGQGALSSTQTLNLLYGLYGSTSSEAATYAGAFHDVTSGVNFAGNATTGFDKVTGLGTPDAAAIVHAAADFGAAATTNAAATHTVVLVEVLVIRNHDQTGATTGFTVTVSAVLVIAEQSNIGVLSFATTGSAASASAPDATPIVPLAPGQALPNQLDASRSFATSTSEGLMMTVYDGSDVTPRPTTDPTIVPGRGDFPTPPILDPTTPIKIWDEALTRIGNDADDDDGPAEPQPFVPWTAYDTAEEDLTEAAPSLLGAAGLAVAFWMGWNRRRREDDEQPSHSFVIPTPSDN